MINKILASLLDRLKVSNPTIYMVVVAILVAAYAVLSFLSNNVLLPDWALTVIGFLKSFLAVIGLGLNSATYQYRNRIMVLIPLLMLFSFGAMGQGSWYLQSGRLPVGFKGFGVNIKQTPLYLQVLDGSKNSVAIAFLTDANKDGSTNGLETSFMRDNHINALNSADYDCPDNGSPCLFTKQVTTGYAGEYGTITFYFFPTYNFAYSKIGDRGSVNMSDEVGFGLENVGSWNNSNGVVLLPVKGPSLPLYWQTMSALNRDLQVVKSIRLNIKRLDAQALQSYNRIRSKYGADNGGVMDKAEPVSDDPTFGCGICDQWYFYDDY